MFAPVIALRSGRVTQGSQNRQFIDLEASGRRGGGEWKFPVADHVSLGKW